MFWRSVESLSPKHKALSSISRTHRATLAGWLALYPLGSEMGGRDRWIPGTHCLASLAFLVKFHANERPMKKPEKGQGSGITSVFTYLHIHVHSCTYIFSDTQHCNSTKLPSLKIRHKHLKVQSWGCGDGLVGKSACIANLGF